MVSIELFIFFGMGVVFIILLVFEVIIWVN